MAIQAQMYSDNNNIGFGAPFCGSQDYLMMDNSDGCCGVGVNGGFNQFCFNAQQKQQQQQQQQHMQQQLQNHQQQRNHSLCFDNTRVDFVPTLKNNNDSCNLSMTMPFSQNIAIQVEKQRQEIDQYIRSQNERLRLVLQDQRKQQLEMLLKKIELKASALLRWKDEEIAKATNRTMELEMLLKKLEMESQAWQRIARENEAMVFSLNNTLEQLKEKASCCFFNNGVEDAESCCDVEEEEEEEEETEQNRAISIGFGDNNNNYNCKAEAAEELRTIKTTVMVCKGCNCRDSCVLFLPCRHLCSCKACDAFLDSCPVCLTPKKASIEALINEVD